MWRRGVRSHSMGHGSTLGGEAEPAPGLNRAGRWLAGLRMWGFSGTVLAGSPHSSVMGGCGRRRGHLLVTCGLSLLLMNSLTLLHSGTKNKWAAARDFFKAPEMMTGAQGTFYL